MKYGNLLRLNASVSHNISTTSREWHFSTYFILFLSYSYHIVFIHHQSPLTNWWNSLRWSRSGKKSWSLKTGIVRPFFQSLFDDFPIYTSDLYTPGDPAVPSSEVFWGSFTMICGVKYGKVPSQTVFGSMGYKKGISKCHVWFAIEGKCSSANLP